MLCGGDNVYWKTAVFASTIGLFLCSYGSPVGDIVLCLRCRQIGCLCTSDSRSEVGWAGGGVLLSLSSLLLVADLFYCGIMDI